MREGALGQLVFAAAFLALGFLLLRSKEALFPGYEQLWWVSHSTNLFLQRFSGWALIGCSIMLVAVTFLQP